MSTNVKVIVSKCVGEGDDVRVYGERLFEGNYPTVEEATSQADKFRDKGVSVLVRPTYNERDDKGRFFREWRSFHGEAFKECRWDI